uniref:Uncharacterized protein n=1 Tax=Candidatus Kentrum sp. FW TaxID=2126338 RepID=A0A450U2F3_9GAMM|nr:MAG: hypothetical protein BECKFW1821C_GA0114237_111713 [Candidatus Kentron sp. FW]
MMAKMSSPCKTDLNGLIDVTPDYPEAKRWAQRVVSGKR